MLSFPQLLLLRTAFFMLVIGLPLLFAPKVFKEIMEKTLKNSDIIRVWAFITMLIGFLFLSVYQKFNNGRAMFFSIFGYASLLKGAILMRWPHRGYNKYKWFYSTSAGSLITSLLIVLFSLFVIWVACVKI